MKSLAKSYRKIVALLAVTAMMLSTLSLMSLTVYAQDGVLVCNEAICVEPSGEDMTFTFVPEKSGAYVLYSYGNGDNDTYGDIWNADWEWLGGDDDSGGDFNFQIVGKFVAGETYYLTCNTYSGFGSFWIEVIESPVKNVEVEPLKVFVGTTGYMNYDYYEETDSWSEEYYYYCPEVMLSYTVTWNDGTTTACVNGESAEYNGQTYGFEVFTDQTYDNQWVLGGTYTATLEMMGMSTDFSVTIVESPIKSIEVKPTEIVVESNGYWGSDYDWMTDSWSDDYYCYSPEEVVEYTITWADGTTSTYYGSESVEYNGYYYEPYVTADQTYDTRWLLGNTYTATLEIMGVTVDFSVTIVENSGSDDEVSVMGDVDGDGVVDAFDATMVFYAINGVDYEVAPQMDMNGDGNVNLYDAARLFYFANDLVETL
ncbi:MAG: hypothetical protein IKU56_01515 [Clostridia bacterium]|nr:hypothetical protein [Clostridia bacterium]